ncbi:SMI1/KNR4 family protein [Candidatus Phycosocius spiralis]|uniref:Knr4/Smi1-like domain-containing protein n=1 Tax=Candidatus Phycosocius spiralis TaxID=2815099 RepID=A0ABQ4PYP5_9PROT|nr:SMI1/KNR4 family protein [Candidatus Phycosocius spiralis]GIU68143.1 hypothetical protein PsB1_2297 [Candidatus Phycosocius spiralis]
MKVGLKGGRQAAGSDIAAVEAVIGQPLDGQFRRFIEANNGADPDVNSFPVDGVAHVGGVTEFIPIENVIREREYIDDISPHAYPIASSEGGNYVLLDQDQGGGIFFWDHEVEGRISKLADSFDEFLDMIEPFDVSTIKLAPGQVKSAWIDPDFLKQFGD